ncbi:ribbon-helix-helix protein, CopG family [Undibacterium sp. RuTC16W]|uniref:ribbon-helix-helix protein, CopG family n=1 Tax=Undibacterium sp. RuTC16W TaxID=3413048 RepID=UPI003BF44CE0
MENMENMEKLIKENQKTSRASVSFPIGLYEELEQLALLKKVSIAWVVRDAVEKYLESNKSVSEKSIVID